MLPTVLDIYKRTETVFTTGDIGMMQMVVKPANLKRRLSYWVRTGKLVRVRRGIFAKNNYNPKELAIKLYKPSYISLETVLAEKGVIFQKYETLFLVSRVSREVEIGKNKIKYAKMIDRILLNTNGVENIDGVWVATVERAFLDTIYIRRNYHFDNLRPLNWEKVMELMSIYNSKTMKQRVDKYYQVYKEENV